MIKIEDIWQKLISNIKDLLLSLSHNFAILHSMLCVCSVFCNHSKSCSTPSSSSSSSLSAIIVIAINIIITVTVVTITASHHASFPVQSIVRFCPPDQGSVGGNVALLFLAHRWSPHCRLAPSLWEDCTQHTMCTSVNSSSRWHLSAQESPYAFHPISQKVSQCCLWNPSNVGLTDKGLSRSF